MGICNQIFLNPPLSQNKNNNDLSTVYVRLYIAAERIQVQQFYEDSALTDRPVVGS